MFRFTLVSLLALHHFGVASQTNELLIIGPNELKFDEAESYCINNHASHLASIHSVQMNDAAKTICKAQVGVGLDDDGFWHTGCWFGLFREGGYDTWQYKDGSHPGYGFTDITTQTLDPDVWRANSISSYTRYTMIHTDGLGGFYWDWDFSDNYHFPLCNRVGDSYGESQPQDLMFTGQDWWLLNPIWQITGAQDQPTYFKDGYFVALSGTISYKTSLCGDTFTWGCPSMLENKGYVGTIIPTDARPAHKQYFALTNEEGISCSVRVEPTGDIYVDRWVLPEAYYHPVEDQWTAFFAKKMFSGDPVVFYKDEEDTAQQFDLQAIAYCSLDGIVYLSATAWTFHQAIIMEYIKANPTSEALVSESIDYTNNSNIMVLFILCGVSLCIHIGIGAFNCYHRCYLKSDTNDGDEKQMANSLQNQVEMYSSDQTSDHGDVKTTDQEMEEEP